MHSKHFAATAIIAALSLSGCMSMNPSPGRTAALYRCSGGTQLAVNYLASGALVGVNGGRQLPYRSTAANAGQVYEGPAGQRLAVNGGSITWNGAARSAPETCTPAMQPR